MIRTRQMSVVRSETRPWVAKERGTAKPPVMNVRTTTSDTTPFICLAAFHFRLWDHHGCTATLGGNGSARFKANEDNLRN